MKLDVKAINKFCKENADNDETFYCLRTQFIAQQIVNAKFKKVSDDKVAEQLESLQDEAVKSFPKLTPCERAYLRDLVRLDYLAKTINDMFETWHREDAERAAHIIQ